MRNILKQREINALLLSIFIGVVGIIVQILFPCSNGFARSGSVIVCVGIFFGFTEFRNHLKQQHSSLMEKMESTRMESDIVFSMPHIEAKGRGTTDARKEIETESFKSRHRNVTLIDLSILIGGTLIWGFGDLFFKLCESNA